jgi:hypothetical protein
MPGNSKLSPARPGVETLLAQARPGRPIQERQGALDWLGRTDDPRALQALIAAAREPGARDQLLAAVVGDLARSPDPEARAAAIDILARDDIEDFVVSSVWRSGADAVWEAWRRTGHERLLVQLAHCADQRAVEPLCRAIVDPSVTPTRASGSRATPRVPATTPSSPRSCKPPSTTVPPHNRSPRRSSTSAHATTPSPSSPAGCTLATAMARSHNG